MQSFMPFFMDASFYIEPVSLLQVALKLHELYLNQNIFYEIDIIPFNYFYSFL